MPESPAAHRKFAVVTGASTGIGFHLAAELAQAGFDLAIVSRHANIHEAAAKLREYGVSVQAEEFDLSKRNDVRGFFEVVDRTRRPIDALILNAGSVIYGEYSTTPEKLDQELDLISLNVSSVVHLSKLLLPKMVQAGSGRVLITSSIAAVVPGPLYPTYAASKSFLKSFGDALASELRPKGVTVTVLMPGPTETPIWKKAGMTKTLEGRMHKGSAAKVAHQGFKGMMRGRAHVIGSSPLDKLVVFGARFMPDRMKTWLHTLILKPV